MLDEKAVTADPPTINLAPPEPPTSPSISEPIPPYREPASPDQLLRLGVVLGLVMIGIGTFISLLRGADMLAIWFGNHIPLLDIGLGLGIGLFASVAMWILGNYVKGFQNIRLKLLETLDFKALQWWQILVLSLWAAFPEEILFRGSLQPLLGLVLTATIFGALHSLTRLYFVYASLAGLSLGLLVQWRGDLWMAIATHFAVDFVGLAFLKWWVNQQSGESDPPHLHET